VLLPSIIARPTTRLNAVPESFSPAYAAGMPKPPTPPDLRHCGTCGKVIGPHKGWFGPECQCGREPGSALRGAHGKGAGAATRR
jgi:hypothetical protein